MSKRKTPAAIQFMTFRPSPKAAKLGDLEVFEVSLRPWPEVVHALRVSERRRFKTEREAADYCEALKESQWAHERGHRV